MCQWSVDNGGAYVSFALAVSAASAPVLLATKELSGGARSPSLLMTEPQVSSSGALALSITGGSNSPPGMAPPAPAAPSAGRRLQAAVLVPSPAVIASIPTPLVQAAVAQAVPGLSPLAITVSVNAYAVRSTLILSVPRLDRVNRVKLTNMSLWTPAVQANLTQALASDGAFPGAFVALSAITVVATGVAVPFSINGAQAHLRTNRLPRLRTLPGNRIDARALIHLSRPLLSGYTGGSDAGASAAANATIFLLAQMAAPSCNVSIALVNSLNVSARALSLSLLEPPTVFGQMSIGITQFASTAPATTIAFNNALQSGLITTILNNLGVPGSAEGFDSHSNAAACTLEAAVELLFAEDRNWIDDPRNRWGVVGAQLHFVTKRFLGRAFCQRNLTLASSLPPPFARLSCSRRSGSRPALRALHLLAGVVCTPPQEGEEGGERAHRSHGERCRCCEGAPSAPRLRDFRELSNEQAFSGCCRHSNASKLLWFLESLCAGTIHEESPAAAAPASPQRRLPRTSRPSALDGGRGGERVDTSAASAASKGQARAAQASTGAAQA